MAKCFQLLNLGEIMWFHYISFDFSVGLKFFFKIFGSKEHRGSILFKVNEAEFLLQCHSTPTTIPESAQSPVLPLILREREGQKEGHLLCLWLDMQLPLLSFLSI